MMIYAWFRLLYAEDIYAACTLRAIILAQLNANTGRLDVSLSFLGRLLRVSRAGTGMPLPAFTS